MTAAFPEAPAAGPPLRVAVLVAHPDDEALWAGGLLLANPLWSSFVATLCRGEDPDRAPRFRQSLAFLGAQGAMGNLDDGPGQEPLPGALVRETLLGLLPGGGFDLILTHGPQGEYTWHRRHEEVAQAVRALWRAGDLGPGELWQFAYEDGGGAYFPQARADAELRLPLALALRLRKDDLISRIYGFGPSSWEARAAPRTEAFSPFRDPSPSLPGEP